MDRSIHKTSLVNVYAISYLIIASIFIRMVPYFTGTVHLWPVVGLLAAFTILFISVGFISRWWRPYISIYFIVQLIFPIYLLLVIPDYDSPKDYFNLLLAPLAIQAMWLLPLNRGKYWVYLFGVVAVGSMILYYESWESIGFALAYAAVLFLVSGFSAVTRQAEAARNESQALLAELQVANRKLQDAAQQVEELAAAQERNRLARELHDSVSQTIFSMTLTAQAAQILLERDPSKVRGQLERLQSLAQSALAEMRALIQQLRPPKLAEEGLAAALERHMVERKVRDGLTVDLDIRGNRRLPAHVEEGLFRTVQEALNNVVKHSGVSQARVSLFMDTDPISLCIEDDGKGFDPGAIQSLPGHMGLASMQERIQSLGGTLKVESGPDGGTRICVDNIAVGEGEYA